MAKKKWFKVRCTRYTWEEGYVLVHAISEAAAMSGAKSMAKKQTVDWKYGGVEDPEEITAWEAREVDQ